MSSRLLFKMLLGLQQFPIGVQPSALFFFWKGSTMSHPSDSVERVARGGLDRRQFLRTTAGGGFALGNLFGLGMDLRAAQEEVHHLKIAGAKEVPSVCPYCAVGCGQIVSVRDNKIINIEGNPDSPISQGTLCPKGAATYQLAVNPNRITKVWYRAPGATDWDKSKTLDWAMDQIADRVKQTRDRTFVEKASKDKKGNAFKDKDGNPTEKTLK